LPLTENKYELSKQEYELCLSIVLKQVLTAPEDLTSYDMLTLIRTISRHEAGSARRLVQVTAENNNVYSQPAGNSIKGA
jgi:hypothetical protein